MRNHLPQLYNSKQQQLMKELNDTEGYITVTFHYVDKNMELKSPVLNTCHVDKSHTSENLSSEQKSITNAWEITSKAHCVTTDSGPNIKRAMRLNDGNHLSCFPHLLNLFITDVIKQDHELADLIQRVENIVTFFHKSTKASNNLLVNQNRLLSGNQLL